MPRHGPGHPRGRRRRRHHRSRRRVTSADPRLRAPRVPRDRRPRDVRRRTQRGDASASRRRAEAAEGKGRGVRPARGGEGREGGAVFSPAAAAFSRRGVRTTNDERRRTLRPLGGGFRARHPANPAASFVRRFVVRRVFFSRVVLVPARVRAGAPLPPPRVRGSRGHPGRLRDGADRGEPVRRRGRVRVARGGFFEPFENVFVDTIPVRVLGGGVRRVRGRVRRVVRLLRLRVRARGLRRPRRVLRFFRTRGARDRARPRSVLDRVVRDGGARGGRDGVGGVRSGKNLRRGVRRFGRDGGGGARGGERGTLRRRREEKTSTDDDEDDDSGASEESRRRNFAERRRPVRRRGRSRARCREAAFRPLLVVGVGAFLRVRALARAVPRSRRGARFDARRRVVRGPRVLARTRGEEEAFALR